MIDRISYASLGSTKISPFRQADATKLVVGRIRDVVGDRPLMVCYTDWGARGEFRRMKPVFDLIFGPDGYATAFLPQAYDAEETGTYRPIDVNVVKGDPPSNTEVRGVRAPLGRSNRYIAVPPVMGRGVGSNRRVVIPERWYEIPENLYMLLHFDDWATSGTSTLGQILMGLELHDDFGFDVLATMTVREMTGLVNYPILTTEQADARRRSPRELARDRLKGLPDVFGIDLISEDRFHGMIEGSDVDLVGSSAYSGSDFISGIRDPSEVVVPSVRALVPAEDIREPQSGWGFYRSYICELIRSLKMIF